MSEIELKPCPFCGGKPNFTYWGEFGQWAVKHTCKGGSGNDRRLSIYASCFEEKEEAIEKNFVERLAMNPKM